MSVSTGGGILLNVSGFFQGLFHIHPALNLVGQADHEVQLAGLIQLLGSLEEIVVKEIVTPAIDIHGVALCQQMLLNLWDDDLCHVNGIETVIVKEGTGVSAGLFFQETSRSTMGISLQMASSCWRVGI